MKKVKAKVKYKIGSLVLLVGKSEAGFAEWHKVVATYDDLVLLSSKHGLQWIPKKDVATKSEVYVSCETF